MTVSDSERRFIMTDGATSEDHTNWAEHWRAAKRKAKINSRCPNSWFGSHKFEPRYDLGPAQLKIEKILGTGTGQFLERFRSQTYIRDICVKCGKTIERA